MFAVKQDEEHDYTTRSRIRSFSGPGAMVPKEPWLSQLWALWRRHRLVLTQVLGRLNHFYEQLLNNMTNFA